MRAITATVNSASPQALIRMDDFATAVLGAQIVITGVATYSLLHSADDPNDLVNPVPFGSMFWDHSLLPLSVQNGNVNASFEIMASPIWFELMWLTGAGTIRATFLQVGEHSHSNISKGPFAPPELAGAGTSGSNYAAMVK